MNEDRSQETIVWVGVGVIACIAILGVYVGLHVGSALGDIEQNIPGNPLEAIRGLMDGTLVWPGVMGWVLAAGIYVVALVIAGVGVWKFGSGWHGVNGLARPRTVTTKATRNDPYKQVIGYDGRRPVAIRANDAGLMIAPPQSGKTTTRVVAGVLDAPGAVVTTSTKAEVLRLTHLARSAKGHVLVFDPEGMSQWPQRMSWDIVDGCSDATEAVERARAMIKAVPMGEGAANAAFFEQAAAAVLGCYLHAAALDGRSVADVVHWAHDSRIRDPYVILQENPDAARGWAGELETYTRGAAGPTIQSVQMTLANALSALRTGQIIESVLPSPRPFDVDAFLDSTDTLYLMSTMGEGSAAPLTTALVATIERHARLRSQQNVTGRFEVPVTLVLDEAPNIAPIPSLPALMTDAGGRGIIVWAISQSYAQLEGRWGKAGAETMLNGAAATLLLGGVKESDLLERLARLGGQRRVNRITHSRGRTGASRSTSSEWVDNLRVDQIRQLPMGKALLLYLNQAPTIVTMQPYWKRRDANHTEESQRTFETMVR